MPRSGSGPLGGVERPRRKVRFARLIHRRVRRVGCIVSSTTTSSTVNASRSTCSRKWLLNAAILWRRRGGVG